MALLVSLVVNASGSPAFAQATSPGAASLDRQLDRPVTITWHGEQLGPALERLADSQQISLWIDRRVDVSARVELTVNQQPVRIALEHALASHDWAAAPFQGVLYVGPRQTAAELATLSAIARQSVTRAPIAARAGWLKAEAWSFPRLSEPRNLLTELARSGGARLHNAEQIPHDLWPARSLPSMAVVDRAVLLLAGFDLAPQLSADGKQLGVAPIRRPVQLTQTYTVSRARAEAVKAALAELPALKTQWKGAQLTAAGRVEEHERIKRAIAGDSRQAIAKGQPQRRVGPAMQRFTLKIDNQPLGPVLDQLARQLKLTIAWAPALAADSEAKRAVLVSCDVHDADLDELLSAVLTPAGLGFSRNEKAVSIKVARAAP